MGAGASSVAGPDGEGGHRPGLGDLPEACVASVLLHLDPPEICRVARLNRAFRRAASADFVWESKLPSNYGYLLEKLAHENNDGVDRHQPRRSKRLGKKEIYASLCYPNPFDGGTKMFWLEKYKGGICILISSKALSITGIDDRRHWNYILTGESRWTGKLSSAFHQALTRCSLDFSWDVPPRDSGVESATWNTSMVGM
uniref:F-box protein PP2-A13 n=1 Tax=Anthurium amnicola TaxID=1678845 RepID=A0A1D1Z331_9ARAE